MFSNIFALAIFISPAPVYNVAGDIGESYLEVKVQGKKIKSIEDGLISVDKVADFNKDGTLDALITSNCGGNGCPSSYYFVTVSNNKVITAEIGDSWQEPTVKNENGHLIVELKDSDSRKLYIFDGKKAVLYTKQQDRQYTTITEIHGVEPYQLKPDSRTLSVDVNLDGKVDSIHCRIWERWGSLICTLPIPNKKGQTLNTGCDRFGALPTTSNGQREFICNNDLIIKFDGSKWVEVKVN